ncbi:hypothetical protein HDU90_001462 [Geranomyces variabilis]|nr:hypothetical protein HDU90_001462 [Geranomyces variabilis]
MSSELGQTQFNDANANDEDDDLDQAIAAELAALPPEDDENDDDGVLQQIEGDNADATFAIADTADLDAGGPELETMDSWTDYLETLQTNEEAFRRRNTEAEVMVDELLDGRGYDEDLVTQVQPSLLPPISHEISISLSEPAVTMEEVAETFDEAVAFEEQAAHERRLSDLQQASTTELARLEALTAEAVKAGVDLSPPPPPPLRRETPPGETTDKAGDGNGMDEEWSLPSKEHGSLSSVASTELRAEERNLERAEERHLTVELDRLIKKQREQAGEQASLQYRLDSLHVQKTATQRTIRQYKQLTRDVHAKLKRTMVWLTTDGRLAFEKERDRNTALMARLHALMALHEALQRRMRGVLGDAGGGKTAAGGGDSDATASGVVDPLQPLRAECDALTADITRVNAEVSEQERLLEEKKAKRDFRILRELEEEEQARRRELQLLLASLRRQKGAARRGGGGAGGRGASGGGSAGIEDLGELLSLELKGSGLGKIPDMQRAPKVRHVILDDNHLSTLQGLECLKELRFLSIQNNRYTHLDMSLFTELRILNASRNMLTEIEPGGGDVKSEMKLLIYLDVSENRLHNPHLGLSGSPLLQYLSIAGNAFMDMPEFPNDLLYEFDAHKNNIRYMNIGKWAPALRIFDASFNNIRTCDPVSMAMCPFLQEVRLSNNLITDFTSLYSLAVCRDLEILSLEANPILSNSDFYDAAAVLFPKLKYVNGTPVSILATEFGRKSFAARSAVKVVKWCRRAVDHLHIFIENEHDRAASMQKLAEWREMCQTQERIIAASMGPLFRPFLQYLYASKEENEATAGSDDAPYLSEHRLDWLVPLLQQTSVQMTRLKKAAPPHPDMTLSVCVDQLNYEILVNSICAIQALWRGRLSRRGNWKAKGAARTIQRWWRRVRPPISRAVLLRMQNTAVTKIQALWRGHETRVRVRLQRAQAQQEKKERQSRASSAVRMPKPAARPVGESGLKNDISASAAHEGDGVVEDELGSESDIDDWLGELDERKSYFLRDETLTQFSYDGAAQANEKPQKLSSWPEGTDPETEHFIRSQFESIQADPSAPPIKPRNPLHGLLLNRSVVKVPRPGAAVIGRQPSAPVSPASEPRKPLGLTADMLVTRRGHDTPETTATPTVLPGARSPVEVEPSEKGDKEEAENAHATGAGWKLTNKLTQALLERKIGRDAKLHHQAEKREQMKDPMVRLRAAHHTPTTTTSPSLKDRRGFGALNAARTPGTASGQSDSKPRPAPSDVTYAWDIRRALDAGSAAAEQYENQLPRKMTRLPPLSYSHEIAQTQIPVCSQQGHGPTLLINNYLSNRLLQQQTKPPPESLPRVVYSTLTFPASLASAADDPHRSRESAALLASSSGLHTMPAYGAPLGAHSHRQIHYAFDHSETLPTL